MITDFDGSLSDAAGVTEIWFNVRPGHGLFIAFEPEPNGDVKLCSPSNEVLWHSNEPDTVDFVRNLIDQIKGIT